MRTSEISRRQAIGVIGAAVPVLAVPALAAQKESRLSLEGYIWQNMANRAKKPLAEMIEELFESAPFGGFRNIELNHGFFTPALKDKTVALTRKHKLLMPSVYVGGAMHEEAVSRANHGRGHWRSARCARTFAAPRS